MPFGDGWRVSIAYDVDRDRTVMRFARECGAGKREYLCKDGTVIVSELGMMLPDAALWPVPEEALVSLMDTLWDRGIRPSDRRYEEEAKLLRDHLDHCRALLDQVLPRALRKEAK